MNEKAEQQTWYTKKQQH